MRRYVLTIVLVFIGLTAAAAEELPRLAILQPAEGLRTHRPNLTVAIRLTGFGEGNHQKIRSLELYLDEALVAERGKIPAADTTLLFTVPLLQRSMGRAMLTAVAWPVTSGTEPIEASVEIDIRKHLVTKDLANPNDDDDWDGLTNGDEVGIFGTDPENRDTDSDGFWDGAEVEPQVASDPLVATSIPDLTVVAPPQVMVTRRETLDFSSLELNTVAARPPADVLRREMPDPSSLVANVYIARPPVALSRREPIDTAALAINTHLARPPVQIDHVDVFLLVPEEIPVANGEIAHVPIDLQTGEASVASVAFSIDFDAGCLELDPTDGNNDGLPDALVFDLPPGFVATAFFDPADSDGELDILVFSNPVAALPSGTLATVDLRATCTLPAGGRTTVPVAFSFDPQATFGDTLGQDVPGAAVAGSVEILGGLRGDCNGTNGVTAADLPALVLELFDGDGDFWLGTPDGAFPGDPVGCDGNADTAVDAGDLSCTGRLLFGSECGAEGHLNIGPRPRLVLAGLRPTATGHVVAELRLEEAGGLVNSLAFSLDLDPDELAFDPTDDNGDGVPDAVRFLTSASLRSAVFDPSDEDSELDIVLSDLSSVPQPFADEVLVEVQLTPLTSNPTGLHFSFDPPPSFGSVSGESLAGEGVTELGGLFADGFESGDLSGWSVSRP